MAEVLVVGAGLSGVTAALDLQAAGHDVVVVDKGRRPGGRMATRHDGEATWDHGAQFLTARSTAFGDEVARWQAAGVAATWFHGSPDAPSGAGSLDPAVAGDADGHPRFRGAPDMRSIPEHLARPLAVRCGVRLTELGHAEGRWAALTEDGAHLAADAVVCTVPAPQARTLLDATRVGPDVDEALAAIAYDPCWAVLVRPDGTPDLPEHGALRLEDHPLHFLTDNQRKGISAAPAVTLHAGPERSRELLEHPAEVVGAQCLADAADWVAGTVVRTHRWRYARPTGPGPADAVATTLPGPLALAGDGFTGGRVEGAWQSGRAAAARLLDLL